MCPASPAPSIALVFGACKNFISAHSFSIEAKLSENTKIDILDITQTDVISKVTGEGRSRGGDRGASILEAKLHVLPFDL